MRVLASISRQTLFSSCLGIFLACLIAYANIYGNAFLWDDLDFIVKNYELRGFLPLAKLFLSQGPTHQRPVVGLSLALDYQLWGLNPAGYHLTQVLLHAANCLLVFFLLYWLFGSLKGPFLSGLLFALHPVHSEAVTAFLGRSELLMTFFGLLAILGFLNHLSLSGFRRWIVYGGSLVAYGASCLSKETSIAVPLLLGLVVILNTKSEGTPHLRNRILIRLLPFAIVALFYLLYRRSVAMMFWRPWWGGSPYQSFLMMLTVLWNYARLLVFPLRLSPWYITPAPGSFFHWPVLMGALILLSSITLAVFLRRRTWALSLSLGWILIAFLPVSNIVPIPGSMMAERWLYLPSVGFCWMAGYLLASLLERVKGWKLARTVVLTGLCSLGVLSLIRVWTWNAVWHDGERLFKVMLSRDDENTLAHNNLGDIYLEQGRFHEGIREYAATLFYKPLAPRAYEGLGSVFWAQELRNDALTEFHRAVALDPDFTQAHYSLGLALAESGDTSRAVREFEWVLRKEPLNPVPNESLGSLLLASGRAEESLRFFQQALAVRPRDPALHFQAGRAYRAIKKWDLAKAEFSQALSLDPGFQKAREALILLDQRSDGTR
jgi:tetratricopeptide (TPR) repeat protein